MMSDTVHNYAFAHSIDGAGGIMWLGRPSFSVFWVYASMRPVQSEAFPTGFHWLLVLCDVSSDVDFVLQVRWSRRDAENAVAQLEQSEKELMSCRQNTDMEISKAFILISSTFYTTAANTYVA